MGFWVWFYLILVLFTVVHSVVPDQPRSQVQHVEGARIISIQWLCSFIAVRVLDDNSPIFVYAIIDCISTYLFMRLAVTHKALWAACCVVLHTAMGLLHVAHFITGESFDLSYQWILNSLFLSALIIINGAIFAGRYAGDGKYPSWLGGSLWGWSFTGILRPGLARDKRPGA